MPLLIKQYFTTFIIKYIHFISFIKLKKFFNLDLLEIEESIKTDFNQTVRPPEEVHWDKMYEKAPNKF